MENLYEKIEPYLLGELAGTELTAFEKALKTDEALAKSVAQHREIVQRLDALRLRKKVKTALEPHRAKAVAMYPNRSFWAMAASLILLAAAIWFFNQSGEQPSKMAQNPLQSPPTETPQSPSETPLPPPEVQEPVPPIEKPVQRLALAHEFLEQPSPSMVRDATQQDKDPSPKTPVQLAAEAFSRKNYRLAADLLKSDELLQEDEVARFLRASARFEIGQFAGAASDFEALKTSFQYKHEARWNFMLCQIAQGKTKQAKTLLAPMIADKDFPFHAKAVNLSRKIKD